MKIYKIIYINATDDLINLGFKRDRLCNIYLSVVRRYRLKEKFGIVCGNILLP